MAHDETYGSKRRSRPITQKENLTLEVYTSSIGSSYEGGVLEAVSGSSYYLWGYSAGTGTDSIFAGKLAKDHDDDDHVGTFVATKQGPYVQMFDMPIKIGENRAISIHNFGSSFPSGTVNLLSIFYTLEVENT